MKLETENLILYPLTELLITKILDNEVTDFFTEEWLSEDNRTLLNWMKDELYQFLPPKIGFTSWIFIEKSTKQVIGDGGYKGNPNSYGEIEIGYEIIESKRKKGYATEAIDALIDWAFTQPEVKYILAKCDPENIPSQNLLKKLGFGFAGLEDSMKIYGIQKGNDSLLRMSKYLITGIAAACLIIPIQKGIKYLKKSK